MKRSIDITLSILILFFLIPLIIITFFLIKLDSKGPIFFASYRAGKNDKSFKMFKFRTMHINTEIIETDKLKNTEQKITKIGKYLRRYSIDEIPQFYSVLIGDMSIVGPRPALFTQKELLRKRNKLGINKLKPGITGYAQINGRDLLILEKKIDLEYEYLKKNNLMFDFLIMIKTIKVVFTKKGVTH